MSLDLNDSIIFEVNDLSNIKIIDFEGTKLFYMDNFYKNPDLVLQYFNSITPPVWKEWERPSRNMIDFEDRRHMLNCKGMIKIYKKLEQLCGQKPLDDNYESVVTNYTRFKKCEQNDYKQNHWWPHHDAGYNGIVYLNNYPEECEGTNFYKLLNPNIQYRTNCEHKNPWTLKKNWEVILKIKSKYNRFVMFDGSKYLHGMSLFDDRWFSDEFTNAKFRINQVLFFQK